MKRISVIIIGIFVLIVLGACSPGGENDPRSTPLYVDNFEDADMDNLIGTWSRSSVDALNTFAPEQVPATDGNGTYALKFDAEIVADTSFGSQYMGATSAHTGDPAAANPLDVRSYEKLCFGLYFLPDTSENPELSVFLFRDTESIKYDLLTDTNNVFREYSLPFSDFTDSSGNPVSDIDLSHVKESVDQIGFNIIVKGSSNTDTMRFILIVDNLRFE